MHLLRPADYRVMPWKNGGGTTTEIYAQPAPPRDGLAWSWRVSIATVSADGPFSRFPGCDRHIMCVGGEGMRLLGGPSGPIDVLADDQPRSFSGDWPITGELIGGAIRDFNLIVRREVYRSSLSCHATEGALALEAHESECLAYALPAAGPDSDEIHGLAPGRAVILSPGEEIHFPPPPGGVWRYLLCRLFRREH